VSLTSAPILLSGATFTSASARLTWLSELSEYLTGRGDIITRVSWLSEVCRTVILRLRNVGVRRTAVLLLQIRAEETSRVLV